MKTVRFTHIVFLLLIIISAILIDFVKPTVMIYEKRAEKLVDVLPLQFGEWRAEAAVSNVITSPELEKTVEKIYSDVLSRTYVDYSGHRIMLSLAYVKDQSDAMGVHLPEICYPAQGFLLDNPAGKEISLAHQLLKVRTLRAKNGARLEPITYWTITGNYQTVPGSETKKAQLKHALSREIPDGLLVRVSTIGDNQADELQVQEKFISAMFLGTPQAKRKRLFGDIK